LFVAEADAWEVRWPVYEKDAQERWTQTGALGSALVKDSRLPPFLGIAIDPEAQRVFAAGPEALYVFDSGGGTLGRVVFDEPVTGVAYYRPKQDKSGDAKQDKPKDAVYLVVGHTLCRLTVPESNKQVGRAELKDALFDFDKSYLPKEAFDALRDGAPAIHEMLAESSEGLLIEGHADDRGSDRYNLDLGDRRARAAQEFLVWLGVPRSQLRTTSYGKRRPVCMEETEECWKRNRRAHVTVAH
jgi:peptidoglycan-associated lipoprotein